MAINLQVDLESEHRDEMYDDLCSQFGQDEVDETLEAEVIKNITQMYDNRDGLAEAIDGNI